MTSVLDEMKAAKIVTATDIKLRRLRALWFVGGFLSALVSVWTWTRCEKISHDRAKNEQVAYDNYFNYYSKGDDFYGFCRVTVSFQRPLVMKKKDDDKTQRLPINIAYGGLTPEDLRRRGSGQLCFLVGKTNNPHYVAVSKGRVPDQRRMQGGCWYGDVDLEGLFGISYKMHVLRAVPDEIEYIIEKGVVVSENLPENAAQRTN